MVPRPNGWVAQAEAWHGSRIRRNRFIDGLLWTSPSHASPSFYHDFSDQQTTCGREGVLTTPEQFGLISADIAKRLIKDQLNELSIYQAGRCGGWASSYRAIVRSPIAMSKSIRFGQHDYGDGTKKIRDLIDSIKHSAIRPGSHHDGGQCKLHRLHRETYNKSYDFNAYAGPAYKYILQHLNAGANGLQIWEGYDSRYHHPNRTLTWSMWGIYGINDTLQPSVYTSRAILTPFKQSSDS